MGWLFLWVFLWHFYFSVCSFLNWYKKLTASNVISRYVILKCTPYFSFEAHPSYEVNERFQLNHKYGPLHGSHQNQFHYHELFLHQYLFPFNRECSLLFWYSVLKVCDSYSFQKNSHTIKGMQIIFSYLY